ncbi:MAG: rod shape-determining protein MreC [Acidimicrobiales bacterium]|nr:rod shape-determining protein MreC [Acidimicrobiales bacterium]
MAARGRAGPSRFTLLVLALASLTLVTLDMRDFGPVETLKDGAADLLSPLRGAGDAVFGPVGDAWTGAFGNDDLEAENAELRARIEELEGEIIANEDKARLYDELSAALDVDFLADQESVVAKVVAGGVGNFDNDLVEIDKGSVDGVREGQPVVTAGGLAGQVVEVRRSRSFVRLISDPTFAVGIRLVVNDEIALLTGGGEDELLRVDGGIDIDTILKVGMSVVTSGIERSPFPAGIPVGRVASFDVDEGALEQRLLVEPSADLVRLEYVTVVLYDPDDDGGAAEPADSTGSPDAGTDPTAGEDPADPDGAGG